MKSYEEMDAFVRKHGEENIICSVHNEPLAVTIDPLTITSWERETPDITKARWMKFICAAWLKLPQVLPWRWEVKKL